MLQRTLQKLTFKPHAKESPRCEVGYTLPGGIVRSQARREL